MYSLYIPKYKNEISKAGYKLIKIIQAYMQQTGYENNMLIAPGYMSTAWESIKNMIQGIDSIIGVDNNVYFGLFIGMNGENAIRKLPYGLSAQQMRQRKRGVTIRSAHCASVLIESQHLKLLRINCKKQYDHRKMVFFFKNGFMMQYEMLSKSNKEDFLRDTDVTAVLIGSSNFSETTYYGTENQKRADKGEADILLFENSGFAQYMKERLKEAYGNESAIGGIERQLILFKSLEGGADGSRYLKAILDEYLSNVLI